MKRRRGIARQSHLQRRRIKGFHLQDGSPLLTQLNHHDIRTQQMDNLKEKAKDVIQWWNVCKEYVYFLHISRRFLWKMWRSDQNDRLRWWRQNANFWKHFQIDQGVWLHACFCIDERGWYYERIHKDKLWEESKNENISSLHSKLSFSFLLSPSLIHFLCENMRDDESEATKHFAFAFYDCIHLLLHKAERGKKKIIQDIQNCWQWENVTNDGGVKLEGIDMSQSRGTEK